jgi:hypothetical protein
MVNYTCERCNKTFNHKSNYDQHLNRLKPCTKINNTLEIINNSHVFCKYCYKPFVNKYSKKRHESTICFEKINELEANKIISIPDMPNELKEIKEKNCILEEKMVKLEIMFKKVITPITKPKHNLESTINPINHQLINLIIDKTNTIGELKNIINNKEIINEITILPTLLEDHQKEINLKDQKIKLLEDTYVKKQQRKDYPEKNVIYMLTTEDNKNKRIYIIGKAKDLKNRLSTYNKTAEHEVVYYKECKSEEDMNIIEGMVLNKLKEYKEKANRDRFVLPIENDIIFFTNIIDLCINFYN